MKVKDLRVSVGSARYQPVLENWYGLDKEQLGCSILQLLQIGHGVILYFMHETETEMVPGSFLVSKIHTPKTFLGKQNL